jgi:hypothetical protein
LRFWRGYRHGRGWFILRGALRPVAEFRIELHQKQQGERFWDAPDYCNNFIMKTALAAVPHADLRCIQVRKAKLIICYAIP